MMGRRGAPGAIAVRGDAFVSDRPRDNKQPSDFLGAFGLVVLIVTVLYAVWTAT